MPTLRVAKPSEHAKPPQHILFGTMADREMAISIGNYIIDLQRDLATFIENQIVSDRRRKRTNKIARNAEFSKERHHLLRVIGNTTDSSALIRALHRVFLEGEESSEVH